MSLIKEKIPIVELLAGLAEECCELAKAALKLRRCYDGTNPTPEDSDKQYENLLEEIGDVELYLDNLYINRMVVNEYKDMKQKRWEKRLMDKCDQKVIRKQMSYEHPDGAITYYAEWHCPHCNKVVQKGFDSPWLKYCFNCGNPILWD